MAVCGQFHLLEKLYDEVLIPKAVYQEATVPGKPHASMVPAGK
jgi:predicted nucleic acid-binding protein